MILKRWNCVWVTGVSVCVFVLSKEIQHCIEALLYYRLSQPRYVMANLVAKSKKKSEKKNLQITMKCICKYEFVTQQPYNSL